MVDCVYIAASSLDARFTRTCVASVRYFHGDIPIRLLVGGRLQPCVAHELKRYWGVRIADVPKGDYGWGFIKLEPLFGRSGERFLVLDSDTIITGPVLELSDLYNEDLIVDNSDVSKELAKAIYYDVEKTAGKNPPIPTPTFLFNTGQWFGRSGVLTRQDFSSLVDWTFPTRVLNPLIFKNGEQGVFNFVANEQFRLGRITVARVPLMHWAGRGTNDLDARKVLDRVAKPLVIHWAGMKMVRQRHMIGADLLASFEGIYYRRLPVRRARRMFASYENAVTHGLHRIGVYLRLAARRLSRGRTSRIKDPAVNDT